MLFRSTRRGRELEPAILQLGLWGVPLLAGAAKDDARQPHWLVLPLRLLLVDSQPEEPDVHIELRVGGEPITIGAARGAIDVRLGVADHADAVVTGKPERVLQLFAGRMDLAAARLAGVRWDGVAQILHRVVPRGTRAAAGELHTG